MPSASDPLDWSVEDVVDALCRSRAWWVEGRPNSPMPDPASLEEHLQEEEVDGFALLTFFTSEQKLKDGLGIKTIGRIAAMFWAIDKLREQSPKYADHLRTLTAISAPQSMAQSMASSSTYGRPVGGWLGGLPPPSEHFRTGLATPTHEAALPTVLEDNEDLSEPISGPAVQRKVIPKHAGETIVQDANGRKKRKLALATNPTAPSLPKSARSTFWSPRKKFPVDRIFYGDTAFGQTLQDDDDLDFQHHGKAHPIHGPYVYRQLLHFMRNPDRRELSQGNGKTLVAIQPYRSAIAPENQPRSVTVFERTDKGVKASRHDALRVQENGIFDSSLPYDNDEGKEGNGWYEFAEKWANGDDKVLPLLGESDDDGYSSSYEAELVAEERERALQQEKQTELSKEEISMLVEQRTHDQVEIWKQKKLPLRRRTARTVWRKARRDSTRRSLRMAAADEVSKIDRRLEKLKEAIMDEVWHKREDVIRQCAILDESICQREENLWRMSVWDLKTEPAGPTEAPQRTTKKANRSRHRNSEEDGDLVDSGSDQTSDSMAEFLENGEDRMDTSHDRQPFTLTRHDKDSASMADASDEDGIVGPIAADDTDIDVIDAPPIITASSLPATPVRIPIAIPDSVPRSTHSVIDLTALSDSLESLSSSPIQRSSFQRPSVVPGSLISNSQVAPENSTLFEVASWDFATLAERNDRKRLVLKILRTSVGDSEYRHMRQYVMDVSRKALHDQVWQAMGCLCRGKVLRGVTDREWTSLVRFARLYACWNKVLLKHWSSPPGQFAAVLRNIFERLDTPHSKSDLAAFFEFVAIVLKKYPYPSSDAVSPRPTSDEDDEPEPAKTPHKKRKNAVQKSASGVIMRKSARKRAEAQIEMERVFQERVVSSQSQTDHLIVNPGEFGKEGAIHINPYIGSRIKNHQVDGVKFMWREIVEAGHTDAQGCLLAHTMGLGKTMQVITLLVTIVEAATSPHEHIQAQLPSELRHVQALVLCPASLVNNWMDELYNWIPKSAAKKLGNKIYQINAEDGPSARLQKIMSWDSNGGTLVMSYEMFRNLFSDRHTSKRSEEENRKLHEALLQGPSIIIADEGHKMKSISSSIRQVVDKFRSKNRIALTGSPLANNLLEYWSMINWVSPGYLGTQKEFRARFVEPIEAGFYIDSAPSDHRKALKKLRVLKNEIGPKISRANITVLKDDLKPKVEFVITVPLTVLQKKLYELCIEQMQASDKKKFTTPRMWQWIYLLNALCTHPASFVENLKNIQSRQDSIQRVIAEESDANEQQDLLPDDPNLPLPGPFIEQAISIWNQTQAADSPHHSFKIDILMKVVQLSRAADDRVLIFSHQLNSLTYLESALANMNFKFARLDGKTKMADRPTLMEQFNRGDFDVFLISTKAGGTGFNLQGANRVIILDSSFNPQNEEQAIGRAYRIGQQKEVFVYRMIAGGTFEPKIWNTALFKTQLASRVVDANNPERQAARLSAYFFLPEQVAQDDLAEHRGKDKQVLDVILAQQRGGKDVGLRAITTTETLMTEDADAVLNEQEKEEVKKMIEAERLRKEDPVAWERYLRANPAIDDSRNNPYMATQRELFSNAAARNGPAPIPGLVPPQSQPAPRPYIEFGAAPSGTGPSVAGGDQRSLVRSDALISSDAGINNAGPSPASMRRPVPPAKNPLDILAERDPTTAMVSSTGISSPIPAPKPSQEAGGVDVPRDLRDAQTPLPLRSDKSGASAATGKDPSAGPGVGNSGLSIPSPNATAPVPALPSSLPRRKTDQGDHSNSLESSDGPALHASLSHRSGPHRTAPQENVGDDGTRSPSYQDPTNSQANRAWTSPPGREQRNQRKRFAGQADRKLHTPTARRHDGRIGSQRPTPSSSARMRGRYINLSDSD